MHWHMCLSLHLLVVLPGFCVQYIKNIKLFSPLLLCNIPLICLLFVSYSFSFLNLYFITPIAVFPPFSLSLALVVRLCVIQSEINPHDHCPEVFRYFSAFSLPVWIHDIFLTFPAFLFSCFFPSFSPFIFSTFFLHFFFPPLFLYILTIFSI